MRSIEAGEDLIDVRDVIERVEELETERQNLVDTIAEAEENLMDANDDTSVLKTDESELEELWQKIADARTDLESWDEESLEAEELKIFMALLEDLKGGGGDEEWRGDWYPSSLINDSYFETVMDELLEDIGLPKDIPSYLTIVVDYDALREDYSSVEYDGFTYWYR